jgi:transcriptional regulator with XRE-family HTH domain
MNKTVIRIKELAETNNATIRELAEAAGCSKSAMQRYISGDRDIPTSVVTGIANAYGVHPAYLIGWVDDKNYSPNKKEQSTESELSIRKKEFIKKIEGMSDAQLDRLEQILALVENTNL